MEAILSFIQNFLKKTWAFLGFAKTNFWVFLSVPHLVDNYAKIVDERGRNLMCDRTLPSRLVSGRELLAGSPLTLTELKDIALNTFKEKTFVLTCIKLFRVVRIQSN